jgi:very-short-patch-repair endonuclease
MHSYLKHNARHLRNNLTDAEKLLWYHLRRRQFGNLKFRRQAVIGPYIVDFVCFEKQLVIELDGGQHAAQQCRDAARTTWLESQGFTLIRFWNDEVLGMTESVLEQIDTAVNSSGG